MKKILIVSILTFYAITGFAQLLKPVKLDTVVTVSLPAAYQTSDNKNGEQTFSGKSSYGFIIVTRTVNPPDNKVLKKEKDLNNVFKAYVEQLKQSSAGTSIANDHDTIIHNVEVRDFTLQTDTGDGVQLRRFRLLYTKPVTYTFDYSFDETTQEAAQKEIKEFFNSIKFSSELDGTDQFTMYGKKTGLSLPVLIGIIVAALAIIFWIITIIRKRRQQAE